MMRKIQKTTEILRSQGGSSLLEFALLVAFVLPPLLLGVIEMGRYADLSILVGNAARAGAAYGAQTSITAADTQGITKAAASDFAFKGATLVVRTGYACACDNGGTIGPPTYYASGACPVTCPAGQRQVVSLQVTACTSTTSLSQTCGNFRPV